MAHRDFEIPASTNGAEAPSFSVAGHTFTCLVDPPSGALMAIVSAVGQDVAHQAAGIVRFLEGCLPDDEVVRFRAVLDDKTTVIPLKLLGDIAEWLAQEYTNRPTTPSSASVPGSPSTPATPGDGSDSPASVPASSA